MTSGERSLHRWPCHLPLPLHSSRGIPAKWWFGLLTAVFIIVSVVLVLVILVQRPQGGGLAGAFGGAGGGSETVFGGRVGDVLTWTTSIIFVLFLFIAIGLNLADNESTEPPPPPPATAGATDQGGESTSDPAPQLDQEELRRLLEEAGIDPDAANDPLDEAGDEAADDVEGGG